MGKAALQANGKGWERDCIALDLSYLKNKNALSRKTEGE